MTTLNFDLEEYNEKSQEVDQRAFRILLDFLQPDSTMSLSMAYASLLQILPDPAEGTAIRRLADECIDLARQIPYSHPAQMKLIRALQYMSASPKVITAPYDLPLARFAESITDNLPVEPDPENPVSYVNINSFVAKMDGIVWAGRADMDPTWSIWALKDAFEKDDKTKSGITQAERDAYVLGAAQHILFRGQDLIQWVAYPGNTGDEHTKSWSAGAKYSGSFELNLKRWLFWRDGFKAAAETGNAEVKTVAGNTVALMDALQAAMPGLE